MPMIFPRGEDVKIVNDNVVLFRPNEWRGVDDKTGESPSVKEMADRLNNEKRGTITHIYVTSDGGASIDNLWELESLLEAHVETVSADALVKLALEREEIKQETERNQTKKKQRNQTRNERIKQER